MTLFLKITLSKGSENSTKPEKIVYYQFWFWYFWRILLEHPTEFPFVSLTFVLSWAVPVCATIHPNPDWHADTELEDLLAKHYTKTLIAITLWLVEDIDFLVYRKINLDYLLNNLNQWYKDRPYSLLQLLDGLDLLDCNKCLSSFPRAQLFYKTWYENKIDYQSILKSNTLPFSVRWMNITNKSTRAIPIGITGCRKIPSFIATSFDSLVVCRKGCGRVWIFRTIKHSFDTTHPWIVFAFFVSQTRVTELYVNLYSYRDTVSR